MRHLRRFLTLIGFAFCFWLASSTAAKADGEPLAHSDDADYTINEDVDRGITLGGGPVESAEGETPYRYACVAHGSATHVISKVDRDVVEPRWHLSNTKPPVTVNDPPVKVKTLRDVTLNCGSKTWVVTVCIWAADGSCPPPAKPDPVEAQKLAHAHVVYPKTHPRFAPDFEDNKKHPFALANAPIFFWYTEQDWQPLSGTSGTVCNDIFDCVTVTIITTPERSRFEPDELGRGPGTGTLCPGRGTEITTAKQYEKHRKDKVCAYTFKHSSTTQKDGVYHSVLFLRYVERITSPNGNSTATVNVFHRVTIPVGEIEAVVR
jgi:hypothetical protein